jgi:hypothetical protein
MRNAAGVRRELGVRTIFNLLGPLTNPARATHQIVGVAREELVERVGPALWPAGYDNKGQLYVESQGSVCELPAGGSALSSISFNRTIYYPSSTCGTASTSRLLTRNMITATELESTGLRGLLTAAYEPSALLFYNPPILSAAR